MSTRKIYTGPKGGKYYKYKGRKVYIKPEEKEWSEAGRAEDLYGDDELTEHDITTLIEAFLDGYVTENIIESVLGRDYEDYIETYGYEY